MQARDRGGSGGNGRVVVPVFPLPNVFLFPGCVMPLHIFESRYRQMIEDLLDRPGRLVMGTLLDPDSPEILPIGGLGEIGRHERLHDGRYLIWLIGLARVRIHEIESDRLYRKVEIEVLEETAVPEHVEVALRARVMQALLARCHEILNLPENLPFTHVVDLLVQKLQLPPSVLVSLYCELNAAERAESALREHARRPIPPAEPPAEPPGRDGA